MEEDPKVTRERDELVDEEIKMALLEFFQKFSSYQISDIKKREEQIGDKKSVGEMSPIIRLRMQGTKHLVAFNKSKIPELLVFFTQMHNQNFDILIYIFDIFETCILYKKLAFKLANFNILKDLVRQYFYHLDSYFSKDIYCVLMQGF